MVSSVAGQLWIGAESALERLGGEVPWDHHQIQTPETALAVHTDLATASNLSNKSASTMEISSMTNRWQFSQPCRTPGRLARATHWSRGAWPEPMPTRDTLQSLLEPQPFDLASFPIGSYLPAKACRVVPPMWQAATPVLAVATVPVGGREPRMCFSK